MSPRKTQRQRFRAAWQVTSQPTSLSPGLSLEGVKELVSHAGLP